MSRDLILVSLSLLVWGLGEGMFFIFQPLYLQQFGADPRMIGGILGAMGLAMAAAQVPAGYLADRIGSRPLMWAAWVVGVLATGIMAFAGVPALVRGGAALLWADRLRIRTDEQLRGRCARPVGGGPGVNPDSGLL